MLPLPIMILPVDRLNPLCERFLASLRDEETLFLAFPCSPFTARSVKSRSVVERDLRRSLVTHRVSRHV